MDPTIHPPLSPAAQAVLDAAYALPLKNGQPSIAAALRAAADESEFYVLDEGKVVILADALFAIAAELESRRG